MLLRHKIDVYALNDLAIDSEYKFKNGATYIVPMEQTQFGLVKTIFEKVRDSFKDSLFYDVSAWTVPLALNIPYEGIELLVPDLNKLSKITESEEQH